MRKCMEIGEREETAVAGPEVEALNKAGGGTERNLKIDVIKGLAILLMVIGHTDFPFTNWIYLFHMAVFFIASGFCWNERNSLDFGSLKRYILRKIKSLYIPYVLSNSIYVILNPFFVWCHLYSADSLIDGKQMVIQIGKAIFFGGGQGFAGATWFLRTLFFVTIGHAIFIFWARKTKFKRYIQMGAVVLCIILTQIISTFEISLPKGLSSCFAAYLAYLFGIWYRSYSGAHSLTKKYQNGIVFVICTAVLTGLNFVCSMGVSSGQIENVLLYALVSVSGWLLLWEAATLIPGVLQKIIKVLGQYSIYIVLLHFLAFKIVSAIYILASHEDVSLLGDFPVISGVPYLWIAYSVVGTAVPILVALGLTGVKRRINAKRNLAL